MSEFKGTKGEWEYFPISEESNGYISVEIPMGSITIYNGFYPLLFSENKEKCTEIIEANAKLIACAPEMFEELQETVIDLKILRNQIEDANKTNHLFDGMSELIEKWIERKENLIKKATV